MNDSIKVMSMAEKARGLRRCQVQDLDQEFLYESGAHRAIWAFTAFYATGLLQSTECVH